MDIEELTNAQLILLTLLVAFMSSVATTTVVFSLLNEAPPVVTNTINRVVERTVERVVSEPNNQGASVITKETTVVVNQEDQLTESIAANEQSLVRIHRGDNPIPSTFLGLGVITDASGIVATDASFVVKGEQYVVVTADGTSHVAFVAAEDDGPIALLELQVAEGTSLKEVTVIDQSGTKLGQSVVSLSGRDRTDVQTGIISSLPTREVTVVQEDGTEATQEVLVAIETTIHTNPVLYGSPLINIFGETIGIFVQSTDGYVPFMRSALPSIE